MQRFNADIYIPPLHPTYPHVWSIAANHINSLFVLYTNIHSLVPKIDDVTDVLSVTDSDVIALTKTWVTTQISESEVSNSKPDFDTYRCDRSLGREGSVLIGAK